LRERNTNYKKEDRRRKKEVLPSSAFRLPSFFFVGGKGGVGKTTCAAAFAIQAARTRRTLLVSTDPASSLSDILGMAVAATPRVVAGVPRLRAADLDATRAFERWLAPRRDLLAAIALRGTYLDEEDVGRLLKLSLPGIDEVIGLLEIGRVAAGGYDLVVVDTAPTGHTLRLLSTPLLLERVAEMLDALQSHHRTVVTALRRHYAADAADALIAEIDREGRSLAARLRDETATRITWVTLPEPMALEETSDALSALARDDIAVPALLVNRVTPAPPEPCAWCDARRRFEARAIRPIAARFAGMEILTLPQLDAEPRGIRALRSVEKALGRWSAPESVPPVERRVRGRRWSVRPRTPGSDPGRPFTQGSDPSRSFTHAGEGTRWVLFGGKGGVGKSTCAAAFALRLAMSHPDRRILLLSSDPAHSLGDVLGARVGDRARPVRGAPANLRVREIDAAATLAGFRTRYLDSIDRAFDNIARSTVQIGGNRAAFRQLIDLAPPGIDEVIAIGEVAEALTDSSRRAEIIVSDTAPTGHALRLLQTPALLREWTQALMAILLKYHEIAGAGTLAELLVQLSKRLRRLEAILRDRAQTEFVIVTRAAALPRAESIRLRDALGRLGIAVAGVIINATGAGTCARCQTIERAEAREIALLLDGLRVERPYAIIEAPAEVPPPHGVGPLARWASSWRRIN
jgi:arsenite/tail-anchored protein-transporting ATPase